MEAESADMKQNIYFAEKLIFARDEKNQEKFCPKVPVQFKISNLSENFLFVLDDYAEEYSYSFAIEDLKSCKIQKDCSVFVYIKNK